MNDIRTNSIPAVIAISISPVDKLRYIETARVSVFINIPPPTNNTEAKVPIHLASVIILLAKSPFLDIGKVTLIKVAISLYPRLLETNSYLGSI